MIFNMMRMDIRDLLIKGAKVTYRKLTGKKFLNPECDCDRQSSNDKIYNLLQKGQPCFISRYGTTEINCVNNYLCVTDRSRSYVEKIWNYISDKTSTPWWNTSHLEVMQATAGLFPACIEIAEKFSNIYLNATPEIDLLGCHQYYEKFMPLRNDVIKVQLEMLYPFYVAKPWTRILKGKKILVIHPFASTIEAQYKRRKFLFDNPDILPDFQLINYTPVQSIGGCSVYNSWVDALEYMEAEIQKIDFDIALLGCGAYGLPLGAFIKRMGKQAVHIGGGLQLLFGIKGKRWESDAYKDYWHYRPGVDININYRPLFNEYWVRASKAETPEGASKVEGACYW